MFNREDFYLGLGNIFQNCSISNCYTTSDKTLKPIEQFDAILFHGVEYDIYADFVPTNRSSNQIYIFSSQESPQHTRDLSGFKENFYNWTMTYRLDSDISRAYGFINKIPRNYKLPKKEEIENRPKKIVWLVSNCATKSGRSILYKKLRKYIDIDVFGKCGNRTFCTKDDPVGCYDYLEKNYKFYLSFENSICEDYITEKMYNILDRNLVPIVYGGANYSKLAPPNSVIDVTDFKTVKQLASFLKRLDNNTEEYLKYFEWKKDYTIDRTLNVPLCTLCAKLHQQPIGHKVYKNIGKWWAGDNKNKCKNYYNLPSILFTN